MDIALAASAALMGLAGTPHCAAMCGAACSGVVQRCGGTRRASLALQLGRFASYALAGAIVAAGSGTIGRLAEAAPLLRPLWAMAHAAALGLGIWLVWRGKVPSWLGSLAPLRASTSGRAWRAALVGAGWAVLPCGLLQSALIVASFASGSVGGAGVMGAFALASGAGLALMPWGWQRWGRGTAAMRVAGVILVGTSGYALAHGLRMAIDGLCAVPS